MPTAVLHASDPVEFYAVTPHFSKFLIGEIIASPEQPAASSTTGGGGGGGGCFHTWECGEWSECKKKGIQNRICEYTGGCRTPNINPYQTKQECEYTPLKKVPEEEVEEKAKEPELEKPFPIAPPLQNLILRTAIIIGLFVIILIIILWRQKRLKEQLQRMKKQIMKLRTKEDVKKEIASVKNDLDALETMYKDDLMPESSYKSNKEKLNMRLKKLKEELAQKELEKVKEKPEINKKRLKKLRHKRNRLKKELNRLQKAYNDGVIDKEDYEKTKKELENRIKSIEARLNGSII